MELLEGKVASGKGVHHFSHHCEVVDTFADARQNDLQNLAEEMEDEIEHDRRALAKLFAKIDKDNSGQPPAIFCYEFCFFTFLYVCVFGEVPMSIEIFVSALRHL